MAKSKKSKILASMLAVSTMAVFYVAPVMAAELKVELDGKGIVANEEVLPDVFEKHEVTGTLTIAGAEIATALTDTDLTLNSVTANTISTTGNNFIVGTDGNVSANSVTTTGDVVAGTYSLKDIGVRTQNMTATEGNTAFTGNVSATGTMSAVSGDFGGTVINAQGINAGSSETFKLGQINVTGQNLSNVGWITASDTINTPKINGVEVSGDGDNGLTISSVELKNGFVDGVDVSELGGNVAGISRNNGDLPYGQGVTSIEGVVDVDGNNNLVHFRNAEGNTSVLINAGTGQIIADSVGANNVTTANLSAGNDAFRVSENGEIVMQKGEGSFKVAENGDILMNNGVNGEAISFTNGGLNLTTVGNGTGMITLDNGTVKLMGNGTSTVTINEKGTTFGTLMSSETTTISGGTVTASNDFVTTNADGSTKYTLNTVGTDLDALETTVGEDGRLGGIDRVDTNNDGKLDTTTIEGSTSFDANGMNVGNGAVVANADGSFSAGNGAFGVSEDGAVRVQSSDLLINNGSKDESIAMTDGGLSLITTGDNGTGMVTLSNGTVSLRGGSTSTVTINGDGTTFGTLLGNETTNINGGTVTASNDFVTTNEDGTKKYTLNTVGNNLKDLSDDFKTTNANVAGIERTYNELYDTYTTHIEGALHISENAISTNGDIFNFSYDLGNGYTGFRNLGKLAIDVDNLLSDVSDLTGRVETVEGKTEHISVDESGNTTISSPNGDTTLTVSDDGITMNGDTVMNGDSTTGGEGGSGDGSVTNPDSDHIVNGGQEVNNGQTVNGGQVVNDGQTVNGDAQFNDQVTVGDTDDNQTVINGGNVTVDNSVTVGGSEGTIITGGGVTVGGSEGTTVGKDGVTVGGSDGVSIKDDGMTVGGENGTVVSDSDVVINSGTENEVSLSDVGNRVDNLEQGVAELNNRVGELEDRIDKVGAMAAAIANLRTMGYAPAAPTEVAVGIGQYRDETGAALGLFHYPNRDFMLSLSVSTSGDEVMGGIGATWKFGRKSPEKVAEIKKAQAEADARRAEEAKLAKAEEMKQAAKEAKIKAQQERHAKLAAERAAQAEAAK